MKALQVLLFVAAWLLAMLGLGALGESEWAMAVLLLLAAYGVASLALSLSGRVER